MARAVPRNRLLAGLVGLTVMAIWLLDFEGSGPAGRGVVESRAQEANAGLASESGRGARTSAANSTELGTVEISDSWVLRLVNERARPLPGIRFRWSVSPPSGRLATGLEVPAPAEPVSADEARADLESEVASDESGEVRLQLNGGRVWVHSFDGFVLRDVLEDEDCTRLVLHPAERVQGSVVGLDDVPIEGARVWARWEESHRTEPGGSSARSIRSPARTEGDGRFTFAMPTDAPLSLLVEARGHHPSLRVVSPPVEQPLIIRLSERAERSGLTIRGTVRGATGEWLENALVGGPGVTARTDGAGRYSLRLVDPNPSQSIVVSGGQEDAQQSRSAAEHGLYLGDDAWQLDFQLESAATLTCRVRDRHGAPLSNVIVLLEDTERVGNLAASREGRVGARREEPARTDEGGAVRLSGLRPGIRTLRLVHEPTLEFMRVRLAAPGEYSLEMNRPDTGDSGTLRGRLVTPNGDPIPGATVTACIPGRADIGLPSVLAGKMVTGENGRFRGPGISAMARASLLIRQERDELRIVPASDLAPDQDIVVDALCELELSMVSRDVLLLTASGPDDEPRRLHYEVHGTRFREREIPRDRLFAGLRVKLPSSTSRIVCRLESGGTLDYPIRLHPSRRVELALGR